MAKTQKAKKRATPKVDGIDLQPKTFKAAKEVIQLLGREVLDGRAKLQNFIVEHEEVFSDSNRLRARNAELVEQITSVNKGSELLAGKIQYLSGENAKLRTAYNKFDKELDGLSDTNATLRKANEYASKRLAAYEAQFGFLPDELEEVEPLAAVTGNWTDFWVEKDMVNPSPFDNALFRTLEKLLENTSFVKQLESKGFKVDFQQLDKLKSELSAAVANGMWISYPEYATVTLNENAQPKPTHNDNSERNEQHAE